MAVTRVRKLFPNRGGKQDWSTRIVYTFVFQVVTDDPNDDEDVVFNGVDPFNPSEKIPHFGDPHPGNVFAVVTEVDIQQSDESFYIWLVNVTYDTNPDTPGGQQPTTAGNLSGNGEITNKPGDFKVNPLLRPPQWQLSFIDKTEPIESWTRTKPNGQYDFYEPPQWQPNTDYKIGKYVSNNLLVYVCVKAGKSIFAGGGPIGEGDAQGELDDGTVVWSYYSTLLQATTVPFWTIREGCMHSGGLPFDPPAMTDVSVPKIVVTQNIPVIDLPFFMNMKNAVNVSLWRGCIPPRCAKILNITCNSETENNFSYVKAVWEVGLDPDTWDVRILDAGYGSHGMKETANKLFPAMGQPKIVEKSVFMRFTDGDGHPVGSPVPLDGNGKRLEPGDDPVYLRGIPRQQRFSTSTF